MKLAEAANALGLSIDVHNDVADLAVDARKVRPGSLFFCISGFGVDGHEWAGDASQRGACALVAEHPVAASCPVLLVPDARRALGVVSAAFFDNPTTTLPVTAITGTSGKTTTAYLIHAILMAAGLRPGLWGTIETQVGTERRPSVAHSPAALHIQGMFRSMLDAGNKSCVIEATSYDIELRRLDGSAFAALVFTNLGHDHLNVHGSLEGYFAAKRRLFVESDAPAAINTGDAYGKRLASELGPSRHVLGFAAPPAPVGPVISFDGLELETQLVGRFNIENVLAAATAGRLLGVPGEAIVAGIASVDGIPGRFERIDEGQPFAVVVDYAHKPEALRAVLETARTLAKRHVICVFGCGGDSYRGKRPMMARIAAELCETTIVTTDNPRDEDPQAIVDDIVAAARPQHVVPDRREAIELAIQLARPGDVVVVAGRGHETEQTFANARTVPFDDRVVVRDALRSG